MRTSSALVAVVVVVVMLSLASVGLAQCSFHTGCKDCLDDADCVCWRESDSTCSSADLGVDCTLLPEECSVCPEQTTCDSCNASNGCCWDSTSRSCGEATEGSTCPTCDPPCTSHSGCDLCVGSSCCWDSTEVCIDFRDVTDTSSCRTCSDTTVSCEYSDCGVCKSNGCCWNPNQSECQVSTQNSVCTDTCVVEPPTEPPTPPVGDTCEYDLCDDCSSVGNCCWDGVLCKVRNQDSTCVADCTTPVQNDCDSFAKCSTCTSNQCCWNGSSCNSGSTGCVSQCCSSVKDCTSCQENNCCWNAVGEACDDIVDESICTKGSCTINICEEQTSCNDCNEYGCCWDGSTCSAAGDCVKQPCVTTVACQERTECLSCADSGCCWHFSSGVCMQTDANCAGTDANLCYIDTQPSSSPPPPTPTDTSPPTPPSGSPEPPIPPSNPNFFCFDFPNCEECNAHWEDGCCYSHSKIACVNANEQDWTYEEAKAQCEVSYCAVEPTPSPTPTQTAPTPVFVFDPSKCSNATTCSRCHSLGCDWCTGDTTDSYCLVPADYVAPAPSPTPSPSPSTSTPTTTSPTPSPTPTLSSPTPSPNSTSPTPTDRTCSSGTLYPKGSECPGSVGDECKDTYDCNGCNNLGCSWCNITAVDDTEVSFTCKDTDKCSIEDRTECVAQTPTPSTKKCSEKDCSLCLSSTECGWCYGELSETEYWGFCVSNAQEGSNELDGSSYCDSEGGDYVLGQCPDYFIVDEAPATPTPTSGTYTTGPAPPATIDCRDITSCSECATQSSCGWCSGDGGYSSCRDPQKFYVYGETGESLNGVDWCFAVGGAFRWDYCEKGANEVADDLNGLDAREIADDVGDAQLEFGEGEGGLNDKFDIVIPVVLPALEEGTVTMKLFVTLVGEGEVSEQDKSITCTIVVFTLAKKINIAQSRLTCGLELLETESSTLERRYVATVDIADAQKIEKEGAASFVSVGGVTVGVMLLGFVCAVFL